VTAHRVLATAPGLTITEPAPDFDPFARFRPWLDALSPSDREAATIDLALCATERAQDATARWWRERVASGYVEAEGGVAPDR
jgi:hypothetical protein